MDLYDSADGAAKGLLESALTPLGGERATDHFMAAANRTRDRNSAR